MRKNAWWTVAGCLFTMAAVAVALSTASYAWFTHNQQVATEKASVRSGTQKLELQIAPAAGGPFTDETDITQVNDVDHLNLMPVSTVDLAHFYRCSAVENDQATAFELTDENYYHGQVFLRTDAQGQPEGARVALYLDTEDIIPEDTVPGLIRNAARLGLKFSGTDTPIILRFGDEHNGTDGNTAPGGALVSGDVVLDANGNTTPDISELPSVYQVQQSGDSVELPEKMLLYLDLNATYTVDVYFYIEGCDIDCNEEIRDAEMWIQLYFYGVLDTGGGV